MTAHQTMPDGTTSSRRSLWRLWSCRAAAGLWPFAAVGVLEWKYRLGSLSFVAQSCVIAFVVVVSALILTYAELRFGQGAADDADRDLFARVRRAQFRRTAGFICVASLFPILSGVSRQYWQASMTESWVIGVVPCLALVRLMRWIWPVSKSADLDERRVGLLTIDRNRRRQAVLFSMFALLCLVSVAAWTPQIIRAEAGLPIERGQFDSVGVPCLNLLLFLAGPSLIGGRAALRSFPEDETLLHFRSLAYRNGFFVLVICLIVANDLPGRPRGSALTLALLPVMLNLAMAVASGTMAVLEHFAERDPDRDGRSETPGRGSRLSV